MKTAGLFLLLTILCCAKAVIGFQRLSPEQHYARFQERAASRRLEENIGRVFYPTNFGADPKGAKDSSDAIEKAIEVAFKVQNNKNMLEGVNDLGGVIIDLQGGDYKISRPISFPPNGGGNVVIQGGSIRASENFKKKGCYLVQLWSPATTREGHENSPCKPNTKANVNKTALEVYYEDITFRDILFDSKHHGGGILAVNAVRIRIDNCYFKGFTTEGIKVEKGHEVFISSSFLGQTENIGGDKREKNFSGIAISLDGNDHAVTDVAIFSAAIGVLLRGQASLRQYFRTYF
ncbi:hypothetical protein LUZ61_011511 [Rhynchospora tenuis]|uniref:Pectate lyase superfamily protein domain-containing protein n=1 Tax=Rhynchospora tenuis TaxID=198213 RepID=A0AAD6A146_9POAL|nr:hypothetical protein LUZ61_011511 [Rhynchospora tenuis]